MIPYYSCIILFFASLHIILFFLHMSETVGERRRSKRHEHDERSDSLDVAVAEVDEATLPSLPLPLPLASTSIDYCRVRVIVSTCVRHAQCVCAMDNTHKSVYYPWCAHGARMAPPLSCSILTHYSLIILFYKRTYYSQRNSRIMCGGLRACLPYTRACAHVHMIDRVGAALLCSRP